MYASGDLILSNKPFNGDSWGPTTTRFLDYIANDLTEKQWGAIFQALASFTPQVQEEEAV